MNTGLPWQVCRGQDRDSEAAMPSSLQVLSPSPSRPLPIFDCRSDANNIHLASDPCFDQFALSAPLMTPAYYNSKPSLDYASTAPALPGNDLTPGAGRFREALLPCQQRARLLAKKNDMPRTPVCQRGVSRRSANTRTKDDDPPQRTPAEDYSDFPPRRTQPAKTSLHLTYRLRLLDPG